MHPKEICLVLHNVRSAHNVGAILRSAACFGTQEVIMSGYTPYPAIKNDTRLPHIAAKMTRAITKTALGAQKLISIDHVADLPAFIEKRRAAGWQIAALEQAKDSRPLQKFRPKAPIVLILGNEVKGLGPKDLSLADEVIEIPMLGRKESLNVAVAAGIALYELTKVS